MSKHAPRSSPKAASGIPGLDDVLVGGFARGCLFLLEGMPGTGKTTIALQYLLEGARAGERTLYITLSETKQELLNGAASHGWSVPDSTELFELQPPENLLNPDHQQSGGYHDFKIRTGGVEVFPRLVSSEHRGRFAISLLSSGIAELDVLLGGGLEKGSSALVLGPAGTGKSLLVFQFAKAAIARGEKVGMFIFDEELGLLFRRSKAMGIDLERLRTEGHLIMAQVDAAELSPGEFSHNVRTTVEKHNVGTVIIDSLQYQARALLEDLLASEERQRLFIEHAPAARRSHL
jgi:KaiC/GvpD/RAD55 family RecA-like ATPase